MKRIASVVALLAVAHMIGLAGVVGWLVSTKRIDRARLDVIRTMLGETIPDEQGRLEAERLAAEEAATGGEEALPGTPPIPSTLAVNYGNELAKAAEFRVERQQQESRSLASSIEEQARNLEEARQELASQKAAFEAMRDRIARAEGDEQFSKAVNVLKNVAPKAARAMLQAIIEGNSGAVGSPDGLELTGMERAIAYLDRLPALSQSEIMAQFAKDQPELAGELLERLRSHGMVAEASGEPAP